MRIHNTLALWRRRCARPPQAEYTGQLDGRSVLGVWLKLAQVDFSPETPREQLIVREGKSCVMSVVRV